MNRLAIIPRISEISGAQRRDMDLTVFYTGLNSIAFQKCDRSVSAPEPTISRCSYSIFSNLNDLFTNFHEFRGNPEN